MMPTPIFPDEWELITPERPTIFAQENNYTSTSYSYPVLWDAVYAPTSVTVTSVQNVGGYTSGGTQPLLRASCYFAGLTRAGGTFNAVLFWNPLGVRTYAGDYDIYCTAVVLGESYNFVLRYKLVRS